MSNLGLRAPMKISILIIFFVSLGLSSFTNKYHEPLYYEMNFNDEVIHEWHRNVYNSNVIEVEEIAEINMNSLSNKEITTSLSYEIYLESREKTKRKLDSIINLIK